MIPSYLLLGLVPNVQMVKPTELFLIWRCFCFVSQYKHTHKPPPPSPVIDFSGHYLIV